MQYKEVVGNVPCDIINKKRKPGRPRREEKNAATKEYKIKGKKISDKEYQALLSIMWQSSGNGSGIESD
jgi:hypothetical protein